MGRLCKSVVDICEVDILSTRHPREKKKLDTTKTQNSAPREQRQEDTGKRQHQAAQCHTEPSSVVCSNVLKSCDTRLNTDDAVAY